MQHKFPKLRILSNALRGDMPEGWTWDFRDVRRERVHGCGYCGCAIGIGLETGLLNFRQPYYQQLGMDRLRFGRIFMGNHQHYGVRAGQVTPTMVADEIDLYIAEHV